MGRLWLLQQPRGYIASWNGQVVAAVVAQRLYCYTASWNGWAVAALVVQRLYSLLKWAGCGCCSSLEVILLYSLLEWVGCCCSISLEVIQPPGMGGLWLLFSLEVILLYSLLEWVGCCCSSSLEVIQPPAMGGLWLLQQPRGYIASWNGRAVAVVVAQRLYSLLEWVGCCCCSSLDVIQPPAMGGRWLLQQPRGYIASWNGQAVAAVVAQRLYSLLEWAGCGCCSSLEVIQPPAMGGLLLLQQPRCYIASWNGQAVAAVVALMLYSLLEWAGCGCCSSLEVIQPTGMGVLQLLQQPRGYMAYWNGRAVAAVVAQKLYSLLEWVGCGCCSSLQVIQPPGMGRLWLLQQPRGYIVSCNGRAVAAVVAQMLYNLLEWAGCGCCSSLEVIQPPGMGGLWLLQQPRGYIAPLKGRPVAAVVAQRLYSLLEWAGCGCCSSLVVIQSPGIGRLWLLQQPRGYMASWNGQAVAAVVAQRLYSLLEWAGCCCCRSLEVIQPPGMGGLLLLQQPRGYIASWNGRAVAAVEAQRLYSILEWVGCGCCSRLEVIQPPGMGGLLLLQQSRGYIASWNGRAVAALVVQRLYSLLEWAGCGCCSSLEVIQPPGMGRLWLLQQPRGYIASWNGRVVAAVVAQRLYSLLEWEVWGCSSSLEVIQTPGTGGLWLLQSRRGYIASWNGRTVAAVVAQRLYSLLEWAGCGCSSSLEVIQPPGMGGLWLLQQPRGYTASWNGLLLLQQSKGYIASWNGWAVAAIVAQRLYSLLEWAGCGCSSSLEVIQPPGMGGLLLIQQPQRLASWNWWAVTTFLFSNEDNGAIYVISDRATNFFFLVQN